MVFGASCAGGYCITQTLTPTPTPRPCVGDCNGDGQVTVNEILAMVNIALGNADATACPDGIASGAQVDVALILTAVNNALNGCGGSLVHAEVLFQVQPMGRSTFSVDELDAGGVQHTFPEGTTFTAISSLDFYLESAPLSETPADVVRLCVVADYAPEVRRAHAIEGKARPG